MFERFYDAGAGGYEQIFGRVARDFVPGLLAAARLRPGQHVLDAATGTGIVAEAAARVVGPSGTVVATDVSRPMLDQARERLRSAATISVARQDCHAMTFPDASFDAVLCGLGLMVFDDPPRALAEFRRVLRVHGRLAVSVNTSPEASFVTRVLTAIGRHVPERAPAAARYFALGEPATLRALLEAAGFQGVETAIETRRYPFSSFDAYFQPIERGFGATGAEFAALPPALRGAVREEVRRDVTGDDGSVEIRVSMLFAGGGR